MEYARLTEILQVSRARVIRRLQHVLDFTEHVVCLLSIILNQQMLEARIYLKHPTKIAEIHSKHTARFNNSFQTCIWGFKN